MHGEWSMTGPLARLSVSFREAAPASILLGGGFASGLQAGQRSERLAAFLKGITLVDPLGLPLHRVAIAIVPVSGGQPRLFENQVEREPTV
jgi:hypothetical protein